MTVTPSEHPRGGLRAALAWQKTETRLALTTFSGPDAARARDARLRTVDIALMAVAVTLPWSTAGALVAVIVCGVLLLVSTPRAMWLQTLARPACALTVALFVLSVLGTTWATGVPGHDKLHAIGQVYKLLMVGLLLGRFQSSPRASWIFAAFAASNVVLLAYSFVVAVAPDLALVHKPDQPGVGVKNYIDQSQGFALCAVVLAAYAIAAWRRGAARRALWLGALALAFALNLAFVDLARTALIYLPVMALMLLARFLHGRRLAAAVAGLGVVALAVTAVSPNLQHKIARVFSESADYGKPVGADGPSSAAMRLEYWRKSLAFARAAPLLGHGTGSTRTLFLRDAQGKTDLEALVTANPHNQTLAVELQWGLVGVVLLWAMWGAHLLLFRDDGLVSFVGRLVVVQNILSSLFNSHLFDFYQGWVYVLGVGIAGGTVLRLRLSRRMAGIEATSAASARERTD